MAIAVPSPTVEADQTPLSASETHSFFDLEEQVLQHVSHRAEEVAARTLNALSVEIHISGSTKSPTLHVTLCLSEDAHPEAILTQLMTNVVPDLERVLDAQFVAEEIQLTIDRHRIKLL